MCDVKVKICGLRREEDADMVNDAHPDFAGEILAPGFRRSIRYETAAGLRRRLRGDIPLVGVFVDEPIFQMVEGYEGYCFDIIQLHGNESEDYIRKLREALGEARREVPQIWKVFSMTEPTEELFAAIADSSADLVLLDAGKGAGETFDWSVTKRVTRPFILAGGLTPDNVAEAIRQTGCVAVDVSSGVETDGVKDFEKIQQFVTAVRTAK